MTLHRERRGKVEILRLDRPEARNAIDPDTSRAIEAALDEVEADPGVWCVVVTGTGPVFCAGADLKVIAAGQGGEIITARGGFAGITSRELRVPLIAAVNGAALAGGFEIALACDLVERGLDRPRGVGVDRVAGLGPVEPQDLDLAPALTVQRHRASSLVGSGMRSGMRSASAPGRASGPPDPVAAVSSSTASGGPISRSLPGRSSR